MVYAGLEDCLDNLSLVENFFYWIALLGIESIQIDCSYEQAHHFRDASVKMCCFRA